MSGPRRLDALLGVGDGGCLHRPDPDRQVALPLPFTQEDDRLVGGHLDPDADDVNRFHTFTLPPAAMGVLPEDLGRTEVI